MPPAPGFSEPMWSEKNEAGSVDRFGFQGGWAAIAFVRGGESGAVTVLRDCLILALAGVALDGAAATVGVSAEARAQGRGHFLKVQQTPVQGQNDGSPLQSPLLNPAPAEFLPGKSGLDTLFGVATIPVQRAASNAPWDQAKAVDTLGLPEAARIALDFSREVKAAQSRVDQADSQRSQALGNLLPSLSLRRAVGNEKSSPSSVIDPNTGVLKETDLHRRTDHALTLRQPLVDVGSYSDWQRRKNLVDSSQASLQGTRGDEYLALIQSYANLSSARLQAILARDYEAQLNNLMRYVAERAAAGASSEADAQRVRARALTAQATRMEQEAAQEAAIVEFSRLTNVVPRNLRLPRFDDLRLDLPKTIAEALEQSLGFNPELASLKAQTEAADWDLVSARARYGPRLDLELTDQRTWNAGGPVGLQHDQRAMVVLSWTLFSGGSDYHYNQERQARKDEILWKLDDQQRRLVQGLTSQYAVLDSSRGRLASGYKELGAITEAARAMAERMLAGNTSLLDLLDVLERVYQTRSRLVTLHVQEITSAAQIGRLLGQPGELKGEAPQEGSN